MVSPTRKASARRMRSISDNPGLSCAAAVWTYRSIRSAAMSPFFTAFPPPASVLPFPLRAVSRARPLRGVAVSVGRHIQVRPERGARRGPVRIRRAGIERLGQPDAFTRDRAVELRVEDRHLVTGHQRGELRARRFGDSRSELNRVAEAGPVRQRDQTCFAE